MKMPRLVFASLTVSLLLLVTACGGQSSNEGGDNSSTTGTTSDVSGVKPAALEDQLGPVPEVSSDFNVAYVSKTLINEYWQDVATGAKREAKKRGVSINVQASEDESSLTEQLDLGRSVLSKNPDALLLSPQSDSNMKSVIQDANGQDIPTVVLNDARTEGTDVYVGPNQVEIGKDAASYILDKLPQGGKVAQIEGQAGSPNARLRIQGFKEGIEESNGKLELVASQPGDWDRLTALNAATNILRAHPDLKAFYANNDTMALGVVEAVKKAGKEDIVVVGTDGIRQARSSIKQGELTATVAESPCTEGRLGVESALRLNAGQKMPAWVLSPTQIVDDENVEQVGTKSCL